MGGGRITDNSHRISDTVKDSNLANLTKSVLGIQTSEGDTYANVNVQNPLPVDGDSVYAKDLDLSRTVTTGWEGDVSDLFGDPTKGLTNSSATNPKILTIYFARTIITNAAGFGSEGGGNFSNVKLTAILSGGATYVLYDGSADDTDRTSQTIQFAPLGLIGLNAEFHTTDAVVLTNFVILKSITTVSRIQSISELTGLVENISSYRAALNVNPAYVHRKIVNETFHQHTGTITNPSVAIDMGDTDITVDDTTGFIVGSEIKLEEEVSGVGVQEIGILTITAVVGSVLTVDRPIGNDYTTAATVEEVITNMAVDGTLASPEIFEIDPPLGTIWQFTRILISIVDNLVPDDGKFGGIAALTNGVSLRATTEAGRTVVFANWKTNGDMKLDMFNVDYSDRAPAGAYGVNGRWTFTAAEVVAELDGDASPIQKLEVLVQDALSANITFKIRGQGRVFSP